MSKLRAALVLMLAWIGVSSGCAHRPAPIVAPAPPSPASALHEEAARQLSSIQSMLDAIAVVRGLSLTTRPTLAVLDDADFVAACVAQASASFAHTGDEAEWRASGRAASAQTAHQRSCQAMLGFFQPERDRVVLRRSAAEKGSPGRRVELLAHELEHAIQMHALPALSISATELDRSRAVKALREGDAVVTAAAFILSLAGKPLSSSIGEMLARTTALEPKSLHDDDFFSYALGARFVGELYQRGGFLAVNDAFARPPRSTAEILHVERYLAPPHPAVNVSSSLPLPAPFVAFASSSRGEYLIRDILSFCLPPDDAMALASDWEADEYTASKVVPPSRHMFRWVTAWSNEKRALRFASVVETNPCLLRKGMSVAQKGTIVVIVGGLTDADAQRYAEEVLADVVGGATRSTP